MQPLIRKKSETSKSCQVRSRLELDGRRVQGMRVFDSNNSACNHWSRISVYSGAVGGVTDAFTQIVLTLVYSDAAPQDGVDI